jgi:hypothetical protein
MNIPIMENAAFAYGTFEAWREVALGEKPGDIYSRNSNPTIRALIESLRFRAEDELSPGKSGQPRLATLTIYVWTRRNFCRDWL